MPLAIPLLGDFVKLNVNKQAVADTVDYMNYVVTATMIGFFALATSTKQYYGNPIECYSYDQAKDKTLHNYINSFCFVSNSYYIEDGSQINHPFGQEDRKDQISYYRWVPIMLAVQCIFFVLPNVLWNFLQSKTILNPDGCMKEAETLNALVGANREKELDKFARYFLKIVSIFGTANNKKRSHIDTRSGNNTILLYLLVKLLYLLNIVLQFYLLCRFVGKGRYNWGINNVKEMITGIEETNPEIFPRNIMCDFKLRALGNEELHTVQCVLMMNMINEKIFVFLYFWLIFLGIIGVLNFLDYLLMLVMPQYRLREVKINQFRQNTFNEHNSSDVKRFVHERLHPDGVLLLKFISNNISAKLAYDLSNRMFNMYIQESSMANDSCDTLLPSISTCSKQRILSYAMGDTANNNTSSSECA